MFEWDRVATEAVFMYFLAGLGVFALFTFCAYAVQGGGGNPRVPAIAALLSIVLWPLTVALGIIYALYKVVSQPFKMIRKGE